MATKFTGDGGDALWTTAANFDNGIPSGSNAVTFDGIAGGSPNKASTCDIATLLSVNILIAFTGDITQSVTVFVTSIFNFVTNATSSWINNTNDLNVDGNIAVSGAGLGIVNAAGETVRMGGDILISNSVLSHYDGVVIVHHSMATPTVAKTHDVDWLDDKSVATNRTWGQNQTINLTNNLASEIDTFETGTIMTDDGIGSKTWAIQGVLVTPENCTFTASSGGAIRLSVSQVATPTGADFGSFRIFIRNNVTTIGGVWTTTDIFAFQNFNGGVTETATITGIINSGDFEIGVSGTPGAGYDVTQASGSKINCTSNAIVFADDGVEINGLTILLGALNNVIGGNLTIGAGATLDLSAFTGQINLAGDYLVTATSVISWNTSVILELDGVADQSLTFAGKAEPSTIVIKNILGTIKMVDGPINAVSKIIPDATLGNPDVEWDHLVAYSIDTIESIGAGSFKTTFVSKVPTNQYSITLAQQNPAGSEHLDVSDSHFKAFILYANSENSFDTINNFFDGSEGYVLEDFNRSTNAHLDNADELCASSLLGFTARARLRQPDTIDRGSDTGMSVFASGILISANDANATFIPGLNSGPGTELIQSDDTQASVGAINANSAGVLIQSDNTEAQFKDCSFFDNEETVLDKKFVPLATRLLKKFGKTAEFTEETGTSYDPTDGSVSTVSNVKYRWKITPPFPQKAKFSRDNNSEISKLISFIAAEDIPFTPVKGMKVDIDCDEFTISEVGPIRSGARIALYELQMRQ